MHIWNAFLQPIQALRPVCHMASPLGVILSHAIKSINH